MALSNAEMAPNPIKKARIHIEDPVAIDKLYQALIDKMQALGAADCDHIILLCVGTDRSTGDCLGPLVGSLLTRDNHGDVIIFGTLDKPVHAGNLQETIDMINQKYQSSFVIALDACLGSLDNVGCITVGEGSLQPGAGVNKNLPEVGNMHITGIVNVGGFMEYLVLQNTRLNLVMKMADTIATTFKILTAENLIKTARTI